MVTDKQEDEKELAIQRIWAKQGELSRQRGTAWAKS